MASKKASAKSTPKPAAITSPQIKHLAGIGLKKPSSLNAAQVRELAGSLLEHSKKLKK